MAFHWPLSTSAICYCTLYCTHNTLQSNNNWSLVLGMSVDEKLFTQPLASLSYLPSLTWDWHEMALLSLCCTHQPSSWGIPLKQLLYVTFGALSHDLHSLSMVSSQGPSFYSRLWNEPKTVLGFTSVAFCVWKLHVVEKHYCMSYEW